MIFVGEKAAREKKHHLSTLTRKDVSVFIMKEHKKGELHLHDVVRILAQHKVSSILVEGGARTFSQFISSKLADKCIFFISPRVFGEGISAFEFLKPNKLQNTMTWSNTSVWNLDGDIMVETYLH